MQEQGTKNEAKANLNAEELLMLTEIKAIKDEVVAIKNYYFATLDIEFDVMMRTHLSGIDDAEVLEEKYEIAKQMYYQAVNLLIESIEEKNDRLFPECAGVEYKATEKIDYEREQLPF